MTRRCAFRQTCGTGHQCDAQTKPQTQRTAVPHGPTEGGRSVQYNVQRGRPVSQTPIRWAHAECTAPLCPRHARERPPPPPPPVSRQGLMTLGRCSRPRGAVVTALRDPDRQERSPETRIELTTPEISVAITVVYRVSASWRRFRGAAFRTIGRHANCHSRWTYRGEAGHLLISRDLSLGIHTAGTPREIGFRANEGGGSTLSQATGVLVVGRWGTRAVRALRFCVERASVFAPNRTSLCTVNGFASGAPEDRATARLWS